MKYGLRKFVVYLFLILLPGIAKAQSRYRFFTLGVEQGLTSDFAWSVCQDKDNYIWIGTANGLNRFDGHNIKQYYHNPADSFSIPGNSIYWMYKDADGELWFSLGHKGVARYNYAKDRFEKFYPYDSIKQKNNYPAPLWRMGNDLQGRIYFACGKACFRYSKRTGVMEDLTPLFNGALKDGVAMIIQREKDISWIITDNGLFRFDLVQHSMRKIPFDIAAMGFGSEAMHDGEFINEHEMLLSVDKPGFVLFDTRTETFRMPPAPFDPTINRRFSETGGVLKDSKGRIWLANSRYGLLEYFPSTNSTYSLKNERSYPYPFPEQEGNGMHVYEDNQGNIWYGSSAKGVIWFNPSTDFIEVYQRDFSVEQTLPDNVVTYFLETGKNNVLVGTNYGIAAYNKKLKNFKNYPVALNDKDIFPGRYTRSMTQSGDTIFITTHEGLSLFNQAAGTFSRYVNKEKSEEIMPYGQWMVHKVRPGKLFIEGEVVVEFDLKNRQYIYPSRGEELWNIKDINASYYDAKSDVFWVEGGKANLYAYNLADNKITRHNYTNDTSVFMIDAIRTDEEGKLWIASTAGLFYYDPLSKTGKKIVLSSAFKEVYNIAIQDSEWIWLSSPKEIIKYNRGSGKSISLHVHNLFPDAWIMKRAFMLDSDLSLWVGTNKGFGIIDTKRFAIQPADLLPRMVQFSVFDEPRLFGSSLAELDRITLSYTENFFSFKLSAFNYSQSKETVYNYYLQGFDKDWQVAQNHSGSYTNVPPGTYSLRVRSKDETGNWVEAKPVTIVVSPPFWQTGWFIGLMILALAVLFYAGYRFNKNRRRKKQVDDTIEYFANSLYGENNLAELCWDIARNCISYLKLEDCVVYLVNEEKNRLVQTAAYGSKNPREHEMFNPMEIEVGKGIVGSAALQGKPVLVKDTRKDGRYIVDDKRRLSELAVPIIHEGKTIGIIDSEHSRKNYFTQQHVRALTTIAAISANKIAETKAEQAAKESEFKLLEIKKLLAESQLMALRAQMNPHFVFNCLNSVQECILTENYEEASLYLNKFSKLFRSVLNNSGKVMITLAEEIEVLDMYLALEHMRFEKSFQYKIEVDEELETDEMLIPSMLLQPYVENALWHGLMHSKGERMLELCFKKLSEDLFECIVEDNGIGRKKALELKALEGKTKRHVSKGMSISQDRINLLEKQGHHAVLNIIDKYTDKGEATGTKVVITLSTYLNT